MIDSIVFVAVAVFEFGLGYFVGLGRGAKAERARLFSLLDDHLARRVREER